MRLVNGIDEERSNVLLLIISGIIQYHISNIIYHMKETIIYATYYFTTQRFEARSRKSERYSGAGKNNCEKKEKDTKGPERKTTPTGRREGFLRLLLPPLLTPAHTRTLHFPRPIEPRREWHHHERTGGGILPEGRWPGTQSSLR